jgi:hypothetical protein
MAGRRSISQRAGAGAAGTSRSAWADILAHAYALAKQNGGAPGVDGVTFEDIEAAGVERWLAAVQEALRMQTYRPHAVRRVLIPKPGGTGERPLGIRRCAEQSCDLGAKVERSHGDGTENSGTSPVATGGAASKGPSASWPGSAPIVRRRSVLEVSYLDERRIGIVVFDEHDSHARRGRHDESLGRERRHHVPRSRRGDVRASWAHPCLLACRGGRARSRARLLPCTRRPWCSASVVPAWRSASTWTEPFKRG